MALGALSLPFIIATLLPRGAARAFVALIGVTLVYAIGGLCCLLFALALIPAAMQYRTNAVFVSHLIAFVLLLPVVVGINWLKSVNDAAARARPLPSCPSALAIMSISC